MRHKKDKQKLGKTSSHRKAMLCNLSTSLFKHGRIVTTEAKAKELKRRIEKIITLAKQNTLHRKRLVYKKIKDRSLIQKIFGEFSTLFAEKKSGHLRITHLYQRKGDAASLVMIELIK